MSSAISSDVEEAFKALQSGKPDDEVMGILESSLAQVEPAIADAVRVMFGKLLEQRAVYHKAIQEALKQGCRDIERKFSTSVQKDLSKDDVTSKISALREDYTSAPPESGSDIKPE